MGVEGRGVRSIAERERSTERTRVDQHLHAPPSDRQQENNISTTPALSMAGEESAPPGVDHDRNRIEAHRPPSWRWGACSRRPRARRAEIEPWWRGAAQGSVRTCITTSPCATAH